MVAGVGADSAAGAQGSLVIGCEQDDCGTSAVSGPVTGVDVTGVEWVSAIVGPYGTRRLRNRRLRRVSLSVPSTFMTYCS